MGAFAIYTGFIYNDIFSKSLHLFHSGWDIPVNGTVGTFNGHTYPFGLDPGWHGASNALIFTNSYKMKMSIVIGVIHVSLFVPTPEALVLTLRKMTFALCLQVPNHLKFRNLSDIWTNFVPQMLFLQSIFGYLVVCILYKWSVDWSKSSTSPPSLLNMLISMFLSPGTINPDEQLYAGQGFVQTVLLLIAAVCVPWLLCAKPYLQWREMKRIHEQGYVGLPSDHDTRRTSSDGILEAEEEGNGRAIAEDMEEEHVRSFPSADFCRFSSISLTTGIARLWRGGCPPGHSHHRVLSWVYFTHCLLPSVVGTVTRARSVVGGIVEYDY